MTWWPQRRRTTQAVAVVPPAEAPLASGNGEAARARPTTGEWDALVEAEEAGADAAMERSRRTCDAAVSAARARRASSGHAPVKA